MWAATVACDGGCPRGGHRSWEEGSLLGMLDRDVLASVLRRAAPLQPCAVALVRSHGGSGSGAGTKQTRQRFC